MKSMSTKLPCEVIIWYVVPDLRNEFSRTLLDEYNLKQVEIAKILGVTKAAVNQYLSSKRGEHFFSLIKDKKTKNMLHKEVRKSVAVIVNEQSTIDIELCRLCNIIKGNKIMNKVYDTYTNSDAPVCLTDFIPPPSAPSPTAKKGKSVKCPGCKKSVQEDWIACPNCGDRLAQKCSGCKARVEVSWKTCPYCAKKITRRGTKSSSKKKK